MSIESTRRVMRRYWDSGLTDISMMAEDVIFTMMADVRETQGPEAVLHSLNHFYRVAFDANSEVFNEVIGDADGTIALSSQSKEFEFGPGKACGENVCQHYDGVGRWVILSGTGAYANLHGRGTFEVSGDAEFVYDEDIEGFRIKGQTTVTTYKGFTQSDPQ